MAKFFNRVKVAITSTGTGSVTCGAALAGFQSLADASVANSDVVRYTIIDGNSYESGTGTVTLSGSTYSISRGPSVSSESNNSAIDVTSSANLFLTMLAQDVKQVLSDLDNVSTTAPAGGQVLSYDTNSASWVPSSPSGGIVSVANYAALPASPSATDLAWTQDTKSLYIYDGTEWDRVSTGNQLAPRYSTPLPATHSLSNTGSQTNVTAVAVDDAGYPITYDWDGFSGSTVYNSSSLPPQVTAVNNSNGVFTFTPSQSQSDTGSFTFRAKASDGVLTTPSLCLVSLVFISPINLLIVGGGGSGAMRHGGGGGAGEYREVTLTGLPGVTYAVTVGAGGAAVTGWSGTQGPANPGGVSSVIASDGSLNVQSGGGGAGPGYGYQAAVSDGGSTGGSSNPASSLRTPTDLQTPAGFRNIGGVFTSGDPGSGGGGGAGGAGGDGSNNTGGAGGIGKQWLDGNWYAAGGAGAQKYGTTASASGVGGTSGPRTTAGDGATNTGSGAGGMFNSSGNPGAGGSGTVRFRIESSSLMPQNVTGSPTITTSGNYTFYSFTGNGSFGWN